MLRPEVAALFELTSQATRFHVPSLNRTFDLTRISVEEAEQLLALPGGFQWLRRKEVVASDEALAGDELPANDAGSTVAPVDPARAKKKRA